MVLLQSDHFRLEHQLVERCLLGLCCDGAIPSGVVILLISMILQVDKQCAHFFGVTISEQQAEAGIVVRVTSNAQSKFKVWNNLSIRFCVDLWMNVGHLSLSLSLLPFRPPPVSICVCLYVHLLSLHYLSNCNSRSCFSVTLFWTRCKWWLWFGITGTIHSHLVFCHSSFLLLIPLPVPFTVYIVTYMRYLFGKLWKKECLQIFFCCCSVLISAAMATFADTLV